MTMLTAKISLRGRVCVLEQLECGTAGISIIIHADYIEAPLRICRSMTQIFSCHRRERSLLIAVHRGFRGFNAAAGASLYFDEAQDVFCHAMRSISPRRSGERKFRATITYPSLRRWKYASSSPRRPVRCRCGDSTAGSVFCATQSRMSMVRCVNRPDMVLSQVTLR